MTHTIGNFFGGRLQSVQIGIVDQGRSKEEGGRGWGTK